MSRAHRKLTKERKRERDAAAGVDHRTTFGTRRPLAAAPSKRLAPHGPEERSAESEVRKRDAAMRLGASLIGATNRSGARAAQKRHQAR